MQVEKDGEEEPAMREKRNQYGQQEPILTMRTNIDNETNIANANQYCQ